MRPLPREPEKRRVPRVGAVLACALLSISTGAHAQRGGASITMHVSSEVVEVNEPFVLEVEVESVTDSISHVTLPGLDGFQVLARQVSQPMQVAWGSGGRPSVRRSVVHTLQLVATQPGVYDIDPASARIGAVTLRSESITLKVTGTASSAAQDPVADPQAAPPIGGDVATFDNTAFLRTVVDNPNPWIGQQVTVTVYLYARVSGTVHVNQPPTTDGFWVQDLIDPRAPVNEQIMTVRGVSFRVHVLKRFAAFPLRSGTLTIGPTGMTMSGGISIFGRSDELRRTGLPLTVEVKPLPSGGPPNPIVGHLTAEASVDPGTVRTGEAATVTLTLRGTGNMRDARVPFPSIPGLRADPPDVNDRDETERDLVGGERRFRWLVVPTAPGRYTIPDFAIPAFDIASGAYTVLHTNPLPIEAIGAAVAQPTDDPAQDAPEEDDEQASDAPLRIRGTSELTRMRARLSDAPYYPLAVALPPLAFLAFLLTRAVRDGFTKRRESARADRRREARKLLTDARTHAKAGNATAFYASIARAITEAIEARIASPIGSLTHADLSAFLSGRAMDEDLTRRIVDELEGSDFARFSATGSSADELARALDRAEALIVRIERFTPKDVPA